MAARDAELQQERKSMVVAARVDAMAAATDVYVVAPRLCVGAMPTTACDVDAHSLPLRFACSPSEDEDPVWSGEKRSSRLHKGGQVFSRNERLTLRVGPLPDNWEKKTDPVRAPAPRPARRRPTRVGFARPPTTRLPLPPSTEHGALLL